MAQHPAVRAVLAMADSQIGYSRWKDDQRGTKYARETQPVFWPKDLWLLANGISFCDLFVTWVFWKALGRDFVTDGGLPAGASYNTDYRASKGGRVSKSQAQPGDVLVFDWNWATLSTNHVGILEKKLASGNFQTIEGNTSPGASGSQGNGGGVYRRVRRPNQVRYVIRPDWSKSNSFGGYSSSSAGSPGKPWTTSPRVQAMTPAAVRGIQQDLVDAGYDISGWGIDGSYGDATGAAVKQLQHDLEITSDGVYGPGTENALMTLKSDVAWIKDQLAPIRRGGKNIPFRQEVADIKTLALDMPAAVLDEPVKLEGAWKGQESTLRRLRAWYAEDLRQIKEGVAGARAEVLKAVQETGKAQGLADAQVQEIVSAAAEAAARVSAEDVAEQLKVTVTKGD